MSYTDEVRKILLWSDLKKKCCRETEILVFTCILCGVDSIAKAGELTGDDLVQVKNPDLLSRIRFIGTKLLTEDAKAFCVSEGIGGTPAGFYPSAFYGIFEGRKDTGLEDLDAPAANTCCRAAALRAFFCTSGTVSDPEKPKCYVEIYFSDEKTASLCKRLLADFGIKSGVSKRRAKFVCYIKNAEGVSDFLTVTGAPAEAIKFQVAKTGREVSNDVNRVMNCDIANIEKTRKCAERELEAIRRLKEKGGFYSLPDDLKILAQFRVANPDVSHTELGALMNPPLSGSAVSKKMKRLAEEAEEA